MARIHPVCICGHADWRHINGTTGACMARRGRGDCSCKQFHPRPHKARPRPVRAA